MTSEASEALTPKPVNMLAQKPDKILFAYEWPEPVLPMEQLGRGSGRPFQNGLNEQFWTTTEFPEYARIRIDHD